MRWNGTWGTNTCLVAIVHHALLQDHPGVLREQGISSDQSCPGDIYHPDFHLGRPAYFDLSIRSTTQSAVISSASSQAGVATAVGEIAKDTQYQDAVNPLLKLGVLKIPMLLCT